MEETEKPTYLKQVFSDKLTLVPLAMFAVALGLGIYSALNKTPDIGGPIGMGNGGGVIAFSLLCLAVAFLVPLFSKEMRRARGL